MAVGRVARWARVRIIWALGSVFVAEKVAVAEMRAGMEVIGKTW